MGHGLTSTDTMFSVRETPWHGLGSILEGVPTLVEAIALSGQDFTVEKVPVYARNADGTYSQVERYAGIRRVEDGETLAVMGEDYGTVQNDAAHRVVEGFTAQPGVNLTTGGRLDDGRRLWMLLEAGDGIEVPGDDSLVKGYLLVSWSHDGTMTFTVRDTAVRVVCQNTLTAALGSSRASFRVKHTRRAAERVDDYAARVAALGESLREFGEMAAALSAAPFDTADWRKAADTLYSLPTDGEGKVLTDGIRVERALAAQDAFLGLRGGATVAGAMADSAWGAWNAAVEMSDHLQGIEVAPDKRNLTPQSRFVRTIGGGRDDEKRHALAVVAGIAGVSVG